MRTTRASGGSSCSRTRRRKTGRRWRAAFSCRRGRREGRRKKTHADYYFRQGYASSSSPKAGGSWADAKAPLRRPSSSIQLGQAYGELRGYSPSRRRSRAPSRTGPRRLEFSPTRPSTTSSLADEYRRLMFYDQVEQVLKEGLSSRGKTTSTLQPARPARRRTRPRLIFPARSLSTRRPRSRARATSATTTKRRLLLGRPYAELDPPKKTRPFSSSSPSGRSPARARRRRTTRDQCAQSQEIARRVGGTLQ